MNRQFDMFNLEDENVDDLAKHTLNKRLRRGTIKKTFQKAYPNKWKGKMSFYKPKYGSYRQYGGYRKKKSYSGSKKNVIALQNNILASNMDYLEMVGLIQFNVDITAGQTGKPQTVYTHKLLREIIKDTTEFKMVQAMYGHIKPVSLKIHINPTGGAILESTGNGPLQLVYHETKTEIKDYVTHPNTILVNNFVGRKEGEFWGAMGDLTAYKMSNWSAYGETEFGVLHAFQKNAISAGTAGNYLIALIKVSIGAYVWN